MNEGTTQSNFRLRLTVTDGEIRMIDGTDVKIYLKEWQEKNSIANGSVVVLLPQERLNDAFHKLDYFEGFHNGVTNQPTETKKWEFKFNK